MSMLDYTGISPQDAESLGRRCKEMIERCMKDGTRFPADAPWGHPGFQKVIQEALASMGKYRRDSEKLAIIKEVFGGGK